MAAKTIAYRTDTLNIVRGTNFTAPTAVYVSALTVLSSDGSSGGTAVAAATRQPITFTTAGSSGQIVNTSEILFPAASSAWGGILAAELWSSSGTSGYMFYSGALASTCTISSGDQLKYSSGSITLQEI